MGYRPMACIVGPSRGRSALHRLHNSCSAIWSSKSIDSQGASDRPASSGSCLPSMHQATRPRCSAQPPVFRHQKNNPELIPIACQELMKAYRPVPARDASGHRAIQQTGSVNFVKRRRPKSARLATSAFDPLRKLAFPDACGSCFDLATSGLFGAKEHRRIVAKLPCTID